MARFTKLRSYRERAGISQNQLGRLASVSRDTISSAEKGNAHGAEILNRLLTALNDHFFAARGIPLNPEIEIIP